MNKVVTYSLFSEFDIELFAAGKHFRLYDKFGSHLIEIGDQKGVYFAVYAPAARSINVIGDFNGWNGENHQLNVRWDGSGIWEGFIPDLKKGDLYKYRIWSHNDQMIREKADPYSRKYEVPPKSASVIWDDDYAWKDSAWMKSRHKKNALDNPMSIYECHLGSWKKNDNHDSLSYLELAKELVEYLKDMNFTHVEFLPVMEHPYYPSWGYLCTGFFAPSSRFGDPEEFKHLVDSLHKAGIGVFLDWVPAHFPADEFALADFDGSCLYEHPDIKKGYHPDWNSLIFNYERNQIQSFLISSAHFWLEKYNADGLRVDAVASMLYLDYSRNEGQWSPNEFGGNENLAAIQLLKELNKSVYRDFPDIQMIAEESTAFYGVTKPVDAGGLGFGLKWMMGWMNDTLEYFKRDPIYRKFHQNDISKSLTYAFSENYVLPLSHDEVVHGKKSIVYKMPGDQWQKFANLRLLYSYMYTHPGQKLLFMGNEIGQTEEWNVNESVNWKLLGFESHKGIQNMIRDINLIYKKEEALYAGNFSPKGFQWIDYSDTLNSVLAYLRKGQSSELVVVCNFTPKVLESYLLGVPDAGTYKVIFNSDEEKYWGSGITDKKFKTMKADKHGFEHSLSLRIPALACLIMKKQKR
jgi:1,4-alpha-glucan branching enzyme